MIRLLNKSVLKIDRSALVFVTDTAFADGQDGYSQVLPLRSQGTVIFNGILQDPDAYAHEIAHMLGLEHTFFIADKYTNEMNDTNAKISELTRGMNVADKKQDIQESRDFRQMRMEENIEKLERLKAKKNLSGYDEKEIKDLEESITSAQTNIQNYEDALDKIDIKVTGASFKMTKGKNPKLYGL